MKHMHNLWGLVSVACRGQVSLWKRTKGACCGHTFGDALLQAVRGTSGISLITTVLNSCVGASAAVGWVGRDLDGG
jgi:hypothetical protein